MAGIAQNAVLGHSTPVPEGQPSVLGPTNFDTFSGVLSSYPTIGFQATNYGIAVSLVKEMLQTYPVPVTDGVVLPTQQIEINENTVFEDVQPRLYLGATANLLGTGCREGIRFLCRERLIHALIVSGGGIEHDIRRAVQAYHTVPTTQAAEGAYDGATYKFSNVWYKEEKGDVGGLTYDGVMEKLVRAVVDQQQAQYKDACSRPVPEAYEDICTWAWSPSAIWKYIGEILPSIIGQELAETTVVYWAAHHDIPVYSPSFSDGDIADVIVRLSTGGDRIASLKVDLVKDIHELNRSAMLSKKTGMVILGGGVVKHHICNANLMRNGADWAVFINQAQEFDGSDAGARPDEAVSWGKIRLDGKSVKVYAEISLVFPLLVAQGFLPEAQRRRRRSGN